MIARTQSSSRKEVNSTPAFGSALRGAILSTEALAQHSKDEIATVGSYLEPFMQKLTGLAEEYETDKAALEREMFEALKEGNKSTTADIIEQRASARHYVKVVNEFFTRTEGIVMEGMQARREAEQVFTSRLLEATQQEYEHVILSMRAEDRKKAFFDRQENHKKLENCRTAVRLDLAAMLLQQKAVLDRKRDQEIREVQDRISQNSKKTEEQIRVLEMEVAAANNNKKHAETELKIQLGKMRTELSEWKEDFKIIQTERNNLEEELKKAEETALKLTEETDIARDELHSAQKNFEDEVKDLQRRLNRKDDEMHRKEARLLKRCEEMTVEIKDKSSEIEDLRGRNHELTLHRDELQENIDNAHQKHTEEAELLEQERLRHQQDAEHMKAVADELREEIHKKDAAIQRLQEQLTAEGEKVERIESQLTLVDDERATVRRMLAEMRAEAHVWLLDQIYLRKQFSIDPGFDGADASVQSYAEDFADLEHRDLSALLHILQGAFSGTYADSHERHLVEKGMQPYFAERAKPQDPDPAPAPIQVVQPGPASAASVQPEKPAGWAIGGLQQLQEVERQREWNEVKRQLEDEHDAQIKQVTAEWRAKSISLAQRLARTEAELGLPRTGDVEKIKSLEGQVRALVMALQEAEKRDGKDGKKGWKEAEPEEPIPAYEDLNRWSAVPKREKRSETLTKGRSSRGSMVNLRASSTEPTLPAPRRQNSTVLAKRGSMQKLS